MCIVQLYEEDGTICVNVGLSGPFFQSNSPNRLVPIPLRQMGNLRNPGNVLCDLYLLKFIIYLLHHCYV